jgi:hypothetical protein
MRNRVVGLAAAGTFAALRLCGVCGDAVSVAIAQQRTPAASDPHD